MALSIAFPIALACALTAAEDPADDVPVLTLEYYEDNEPRVLRPSRSRVLPGRSYEPDKLPLIITSPTLLQLGDATYALFREGLYRVRQGNGKSSKVVRQAIVSRGDVWRLAGHLSRVYVYGNRHLSETQAQWDEHVRNGEPLSLQCFAISSFVHHHLSALEIPSRQVSCVTGSNWDNCNDGHALMEIRDPKEDRWILFDPTIGARFWNDGHWLDLVEATQLYRSGKHAERIEFLNNSIKLDPLQDYEALFKSIRNKDDLKVFVTRFKPLLRNDVEAIHKWYGRVMQIPLIGLRFVPESDAEDTLLRTLPPWKELVRMTIPQFRDFYYGQVAEAAKPAAPSR
jgi:hypothetical protein